MSTTAFKRSRPTKRPRRTRTEIDGIKSAIATVLEEIQPATVRQLYYQLVSRKVIAKTEAEYKMVVRQLGLMRRAGAISFDWLADNTRWMRKPRSYSSIEQLLESTAELYRRDAWQNQNAYVEIWLEKDALAGVLWDVTAKWDVPLMVTRGYPSITFLHSSAEAIASLRKPAYLYYFGDKDPSGLDIPRKVEAGIREFAPDAEIHFERVAVNDDQIAEFQLPTRPTKKTDSRSKDFDGESVEVDALPPAELRAIATRCITKHIDARAYNLLKRAESSERGLLQALAAERGIE